jgi:hypothetical protein
MTKYCVAGGLQPLTGYHLFTYWDNYIVCGGGGDIPLTQLSSSLVFYSPFLDGLNVFRKFV